MATLLALIRADAAPLDAPVVPVAWTRVVEADRWCSVYPLGRVDGRHIHMRLVLRDAGTPTRAVFVCTGPASMLTRLADRIAADGLPWTRTWATLAALRADGSAAAVAVRAAWPDERPRGAGTLVAHWRRMAGSLAEDAET